MIREGDRLPGVTMGWSDTFALKNKDLRFVTCVRDGALEV
jgi:hypothetical protein